MGVEGGGRRGSYDRPLHACRSTRAAINLDAGALLETDRATYEFLRSLTGHFLEGFDHIALLTIYGEGQVAVIHSLFCVTLSEYKDGLGYLWYIKGEFPSKGLPTLEMMSYLHVAEITLIWGHATTLISAGD